MSGYLDALARAARLAGRGDTEDPDDTGGAVSLVPALPRPRPTFEPVWGEPETPAWPDLEEVVETETLPPDPVRGTVVAQAGAPAAVRASERPEAGATTDLDRARPTYTAEAGPGRWDRTVAQPDRVGRFISDAGKAEDAGVALPQPPAGMVRGAPDEPTISRTPRAESPVQPTEGNSATQPEASWRPSAEAADRAVAGQSDAAAQRPVTPSATDQDGGEPRLWARAEAYPAPASPLAAVTAADERPADGSRQPVVIEIGRIEVRIAAEAPAPPRRERPPPPRTGPTLAEYLEGLPGAGGR
ncbi:hypothetical protein [Micromonospora sp. SL4-19]|uniref:hypothetical protein n=1 Tax=Micromonospora sp. SL4-19 TaxID=3399129 RepID=UPI003A4E34EF